MTMKKIVIFGASGRTGLSAVKAALKKGLNVRAFVRDPSKLPENLRSKVEIKQGDVLNYKDVSDAIEGVSAVIVAIGTRNDGKRSTVSSQGTSNIMKAMKEHGVEIVSVCSSASLFWALEDVPRMFHELDADHRRQVAVVKQSNLKYIAVLPGYILDLPGTDYSLKVDDCPGDIITKDELGRCLVDCLTMPEYYGKVVGVCNEPQKRNSTINV